MDSKIGTPALKSKYQSFSLCAVGIFIFSFFLRLALIGHGPFHSDSLQLAQVAQETLDTGQLHYSHSHGFPLTVLLSAGSLSLLRLMGGDDPVFAVNFMSVVFASLVIWIFYYFVQRLLNASTAIFSAFLLSVSPIFLGNSLYGNSHMPAAFFILLGLYWAWRFVQQGGYWTLFWMSVLFGLGLVARLQDAAAVYPAFLIMVWYRSSTQSSYRKRAFIFYSLVFTSLAAGITAVFYFPFIVNLIQSGSSSVKNFFYSELFYALTWRKYYQYVVIYWSFLHDTATMLGLILFGVGMIVMKPFRIKALIGIWFLFVFFGFSLISFCTPRLLMMALFPMYMGIGYALHGIGRRSRLCFFAACLLFIFLIIVPLQTHLDRFKMRHAADLATDFAYWVGEIIEPNAYVIIADGSIFYRMAGVRLLSRPLRRDQLFSGELKVFKKRLDDLLGQGTPVYMTSYGLFTYDPGGIFSQGMQKYYCIKSVGSRLSESWHRGVLAESVLVTEVFRIYPKEFCAQ